ncbi:MAG: universal stress protein [Thermodesulfovibrionales bacterium]
MKKILIAYDGSRLAGKAALKAFAIARSFGSRVTILTVIPELYLAELMETDRIRILDMLTKDAERSLRKIAAKAGDVPVKTVIRNGNPATELLALADASKTDLIVTGSHGRHGAVKFLLGSVSAKVVDHARCSVMVVK